MLFLETRLMVGFHSMTKFLKSSKASSVSRETSSNRQAYQARALPFCFSLSK
jgi:hypothetical protein